MRQHSHVAGSTMKTKNREAQIATQTDGVRLFNIFFSKGPTAVCCFIIVFTMYIFHPYYHAYFAYAFQ